jgi:large subunit ribosomal protein L10
VNSENKALAVAELKDNFLKSKAVFFADYKGLTVEQVTELRRRLRSQNVKVKVIKNNLARRAVEEAGLG